jgi:multidrug efflux pump
MLHAIITRTRVMLGLLAVLFALGTWAYLAIPKEDSPDVPIPVMYVSVNLPGIAPEDAVNLLVKPLEAELRGLTGLDELEATAYEGGANVVVKFAAGFNPKNALADVRAKVDLAKSKLPAEAKEPVVTEVNISLFPILSVVLNGDIPERAMRKLAEDLQDKIEAVPGVLEVPITGTREEMLLIEVNRTALETYGIPLQNLLEVVTGNNRLIPSGSMEVGNARYAIKVPSLFKTPDDVLNLPLLNSGNAVVRVRDVADVRATFKDAVTFARVNGQPAVTLDVKKRIGANILEVVDAVKATVDAEAKHWPANVGYTFLSDKSPRYPHPAK